MRYWDALAKADSGQPQAFVSFIEARAIDTMAMIGDLLRQSKAPLSDEAVRLRALLISHGGLSHAEVQTVGHRLTQTLQDASGRQSMRSVSRPTSFAGSSPSRAGCNATSHDPITA